jgi:acyl-CoA thioester hydrolase
MDERPGPVQCGLAVVHPWLCDAMGHLTTRHYLGMFDDASYQLFLTLGYDPAVGIAQNWGWADVRHEIEYRSELAAGAIIVIEGRITALGRSSITSEFTLMNRPDRRVAAILTARTVCFDLLARRSRVLPQAIVDASAALFDCRGDPA